MPTHFYHIKHRCDEFYFLTDPVKHITQHFPEESKWQLLEPPWSRGKFEDIPHLKSTFFNLGLSFDKATADDWFGSGHIEADEDGCVALDVSHDRDQYELTFSVELEEIVDEVIIKHRYVPFLADSEI